MKKIKPGEKFQLHDQVFEYTVSEKGSILIKPVTNGKPRKAVTAFVAPTIEEVIAYFKEEGYSEAGAVKAFNYYAKNSWKDSNDKPVKNWKQKMNGNWMRDEYKVPDTKNTEGYGNGVVM